jgi:hypothetical protein
LNVSRLSRGAAFAAIAACVLAGGCGGGAQPAASRNATFPVLVTRSPFPAHQRLAQRTLLLISVRNIGRATIPNVAVTITDPRWGAAAQPFSTLIPAGAGLASRSRPVWIIDRPPGACRFGCPQGGPGGAATAYANTWALGPLAPGHAARFAWVLTAVAAGRFLVAYRVAAGLNPAARAVLPGNRPAAGVFAVTILRRPRRSYVENNGRVVYSR